METFTQMPPVSIPYDVLLTEARKTNPGNIDVIEIKHQLILLSGREQSLLKKEGKTSTRYKNIYNALVIQYRTGKL